MQFGMVGIGRMGQGLVRRAMKDGHDAVAYDIYPEPVEAIAAEGATPAFTLEEFAGALTTPRVAWVMVPAAFVDETVDKVAEHFEAGDIIIDGGNSMWQDDIDKAAVLAEKGIHYVDIGTSGGVYGELRGFSLMVGGEDEVVARLAPLLDTLAPGVGHAKRTLDDDGPLRPGENGWLHCGPNGAGHFVKMVHNGIEYGDMQLICEAYQFMKQVLGMDNQAMQAVFAEWDKGKLDSYLIEITADILGFKENDAYVVDSILDKAGQKGTGKWTGINALELGIPLTLIGEAVFARCLSALKTERKKASTILLGPATTTLPFAEWIDALGDALYASKIVSYAQGYMLMKAAGEEYGWTLNYGGIARMWRGGCIIRSAFLDNIKEAFDKDPGLENLLLDDFFSESVQAAQNSWRKVLSEGIQQGVSMPAMTSALSFYDGYRSETLPHNLLQAQRDYFGAHTYQKLGMGDERFHSNWTGTGGDVSSSSYTV